MKNKGFSIIEVLVAVAIMTTTTLAIAELLSQFSKFRRYMDASSEFANFMNTVDVATRTENSCLGVFGTEVINPKTDNNTNTLDPDVKTSLSKVFTDNKWNNDSKEFGSYDVPIKIGPTRYYTLNNAKFPLDGQLNANVLISSVKMAKIGDPKTSKLPIKGVPQDVQTHYLRLKVRGEILRAGTSMAEALKSAQATGPGYLKEKSIDFNLVVVGSGPNAGSIAACGAETSAAGLCLDMGGTWDNGGKPGEQCNLVPGLYEDLKDQLGGCIQAGGFTRESGRCDSPHPSTGKCTCPAGYTAMQTSDFTAGGGKSSVSIDIFGCFDCTK